MVRTDPYMPSGESLYECPGCGDRVQAKSHPGGCPECSVSLRHIAVPRE